MMSRIQTTFENLKNKNEKAFIAYITAGDPDIKTTLNILKVLSNSGVDIIELGIPFSDPFGDGPVNQASSERALKNDIDLDKILSMIGEFKALYNTPVIVFSYLNPIFSMGYKTFSQKASKCGVDGFLGVDGPYDMCHELRQSLEKANISSIYLVAPTTRTKRAEEIQKHSGGFIYYVSSLGVTGTRNKFSSNLKKNVAQLKKITKKPVCVGFGISDPDSAKQISKISDGVIVGSAYGKILEKYNSAPKNLIKQIELFTKQMVDAVKKC